MNEEESRKKALEIALLDSETVKWPRVAFPQSGFKRKLKKTQDAAKRY